MASELSVQTIKGPASGGNANKILVPSGHTLDASSGGLTPPAGHVVQVVESARTVWSNTATAYFVSTGHSVAITPTSTSNKILLMGQMNGTYMSTTNAYMQIKLYKNSSDIAWLASNYGQNANGHIGESFSWSYLDSPSTTSATTYELYYRAPYGGTTVGYNNYAINGNNTTRSSIIAMEISA